MADNTKDVELRIRAKDYSQKTLEQLVDTLAKLVDAQQEQFDAAKKGEVSARALEKSYQQLEQAAKALIGQSALIKQFQNQAAALEEVKTRVDSARRAQEQYLSSVAGLSTLTKEQTKQMTANANAVKSAEKAQLALEGRIATTQQKMAAFGISVQNVAQAEQAIVAGVSAANTAMERQGDALDSLEKDVNDYRTALARTKNEQDAMRRSQETQVSNLWVKLLDEQIAKEQKLLALEQDIARERAADQAMIKAGKDKQLAVDKLLEEEQERIANKARQAAREQASALQAQRVALGKAADEADRMARQFAKIATGGKSTFAKGLADALRDIQDPAAAAMKSLQGIDSALNNTETRIRAIKGPIEDYKAALQEAESAQRGLIAIAGQVDAYQRQMTAVRATRAELQQARQALTQLATQARAGTGGDDIVQKMNAAQAALKRASIAMAEETSKAHTMRDALRAAGVETSNLAATQTKLTTQANRARGAVVSLTDAYRKHGAAVSASEKAGKSWLGSGRTTLSFLQRMRGELLGLATAYVGVNAAINLASKAIELYQKKQQLQVQLSQVVGQDAQAIAKEMKFLEDQANRLGFSFFDIAQSYGRFAIAAKASGTSLEETRFIFTKMAESARVAGLSTAEFEGILKAMEQMLSKGTIQAEELRGQLGDRLPGAIATMAAATGKSMAQVTKEMEQGLLTAHFLVDFARKSGQQVAGAIEKSEDTLVAQLGRFQTAKDKFILAFAEAGFIDAFADFLEKLTKVLGSPEGKQLAEALSEGFTLVVKALGFAIEHLDALKVILGSLVVINVYKWLSLGVTGFTAMTTSVVATTAEIGGLLKLLNVGFIRTFTAAAATMVTTVTGITAVTRVIRVLTVALKFLGRAIPILGALLIAYEIYTHFSKKKGQEAGEEFADGFKETADAIDPGTTGADVAGPMKIAKLLEQRKTKLEEDAASVRKKEAKDNLAERLKLVDESYNDLRDIANKEIPDAKKRAQALEDIQKQSLEAQAVEKQKFLSEQEQDEDSSAKRRARLADEIAQGMIRIEDDLQKRKMEADPSAPFEERRLARVKAIEHAYDDLLKKIAEGKREKLPGMVKAEAQVKEVQKQRGDEESKKVTLEEISKLENDVNQTLQIRAAQQQTLQTQYDERQISEELYASRMKETNAEASQTLTTLIPKLQAFAEANKNLMDPEKYKILQAHLVEAQAKNNEVAQNHLVDIGIAQDNMNRAVMEYEAELLRIHGLEEAGVLLKHQAVDAQAELNVKTRDQLIALAEAQKARLLAASTPANKEQTDMAIAQLDVYIEKLKSAETTMTSFQQTVTGAAAAQLNNAFDQATTSLEMMVTEQMSVKEGFEEMGRASVQFFAQFLRDIAIAMIKQQMLNAMKAQGGWMGAVATAMQGHEGGIVGMPLHSRRVDASIFAGAMRLHDGGMPGLQRNEVPAILQKGEEVLARDDPRNALNGAGGGAGGSAKFVLVDDRARVAEAMTGTEGENVTMIHLRKNIPTLKQWMR